MLSVPDELCLFGYRNMLHVMPGICLNSTALYSALLSAWLTLTQYVCLIVEMGLSV